MCNGLSDSSKVCSRHNASKLFLNVSNSQHLIIGYMKEDKDDFYFNEENIFKFQGLLSRINIIFLHIYSWL